MTRIRGSKRSEAAARLAFVGLVGATGCAGPAASAPQPFAAGSPDLASANAPAGGEASRPARRPDAVVLEPSPAVPPPVELGAGRGVLTLREPIDAARVAAVVESFFRAWQRESLEDLAALLTPDAGPLEGRGRGRAALTEAWRQRLQAHDYGRLAGADLVLRERIERWTWAELGGRDAPLRPADMRPDEIYVRAPLEVTHAAGERLFGDVAILVLRREGGDVRIASYGESGLQ